MPSRHAPLVTNRWSLEVDCGRSKGGGLNTLITIGSNGTVGKGGNVMAGALAAVLAPAGSVAICWRPCK